MRARDSLHPIAALFAVALLACSPACSPAHRQGAQGGDGGMQSGADGGVRPPEKCGDGIVEADRGEQCDDGNTVSGDGCSSDCKIEIPKTCGNGVLDPGEQCDDGNNVAGDGCGPGCWIEGCGNHYLDPGEVCDDGNTVSGDGCSADCKSNETCGNGIVDPGEQCDDGNTDDTDACPSTCKMATCGDGFVWKGHESCDDGNNVAGDGCTDCVLDSCGNGRMDPGEECDDGAANGTQGSSCFSSCVTTQVSFADPATFALDVNGTHAQGMASLGTADFNGDGRPDLFADGTSSEDVTVAYGLGNGDFWAPDGRVVSSTARGVAIADVNKDGIPDVVAAVDGSPGEIAVMLGDGSGLGAPTTVSAAVESGGTSTGGNSPSAVAIADVNGDGNPDVVTANRSSNDVTVFTGDGTGAFTASARFGTSVGVGGNAPVAIALADVTGDKKLDIITADSSSDDVAVLAGMGSGSFAPAVIYTTRIGAGGSSPVAIAVADVTGDGRADVITANSGSDDVTVLAGKSDGTLAAPVRFSTLDGKGGGKQPSGVAVGDVTGDGLPDIVTTNRSSNDVSILANSGPGLAFGAPTVVTVSSDPSSGSGAAAGIAPVAVAIADINGDSIPDIITADQSKSDLGVLIGKGKGAFDAVKNYDSSVGYSGFDPTAVAIGDLNGDGAPDAVVGASGMVIAVAGLGDGRFAPAQTIRPGLTGTSAVADIDGDGRLDIATSVSTSFESLLQDVAGKFTSKFGTSMSITGNAVALGDLNGDGAPDAVVISTSSSLVEECTNNKSGGFSQREATNLPTEPRHVILADVTGDKVPDMVAVVPSQNTVEIAPGDGAGTFGSLTAVSTAQSSSGQQPVFVQAADLNGDMKTDLLTANNASNDVTVLLGKGSASFDAPKIVPMVVGSGSAQISSVRVGDFNADGIPDIATANTARSTVGVALGFGQGAFSAPQTFPVPFEPVAIAVADFDGDGVDDIAAVSADGQVAVLRGLGRQ